MKKEIAEIVVLYPEQKQVYQTTDGIIHLTEVGAVAQAQHLPDQKITTIQCPTLRVTSAK